MNVILEAFFCFLSTSHLVEIPCLSLELMAWGPFHCLFSLETQYHFFHSISCMWHKLQKKNTWGSFRMVPWKLILNSEYNVQLRKQFAFLQTGVIVRNQLSLLLLLLLFYDYWYGSNDCTQKVWVENFRGYLLSTFP